MRRYALLVLLLGLGGCRKSDPADCPSGMTADPKRSMPGRHLWCNDQDGQGARYIEFHPGRKQLRQICEYRNGRPAGSFSAWLPGGQPWISGQYLAGKPDGRWEQRDSSGNKTTEAVYRNGQLIAGVPVAGTAACERVGNADSLPRPRQRLRD